VHIASHGFAKLRQFIVWIVAAMGALPLLAVLLISLFGWNWLRSPMQHLAVHKTGRELMIQGDLGVEVGWTSVRLRAADVRFANPAWAQQPQMLVARGVEVEVDWVALLHGAVVFPEVRLEHATVSLERSPDSRKSWLLDLDQLDESARIQIGSVALDHGTLVYEDAGQKTRIRVELSTMPSDATDDAVHELKFSASGQYKGLEMTAQGSGGPVLALRDASIPYSLTLTGRVGHTTVRLAGTVTGLLTLSAADMRLALSGDSMGALYPLLGLAFPDTRAYATQGHLTHVGNTWRYADFSGRMGTSDIAGSMQIVTGGKRPALTGTVHSNLLALDDLGPVIGARGARTVTTAALHKAHDRVLPDMPFNTGRWNSADADVQFAATVIRSAQLLPVKNLVARLLLRDSVLTIDPLAFGIAGGRLSAKVTLDGRSNPIQAHAQLRLQKLSLAKLIPKINLGKNSIGQVHGDFDLSGHGNSVGAMLATANGRLGMVVSDGQISKLAMEKAGLHLWEIMGLKITGDRLVKLRCAVADFDVKQGKMKVAALVLDTAVTTLIGSGSIDLQREQLDLTFIPRTKNTSPLALRSPIYVRGSFARPSMEIDKDRVALRAVGALSLSLISPLLALIPLIDAGPGRDSDCGQLVRCVKKK
jgi:AsmA protein